MVRNTLDTPIISYKSNQGITKFHMDYLIVIIALKALRIFTYRNSEFVDISYSNILVLKLICIDFSKF